MTRTSSMMSLVAGVSIAVTSPAFAEQPWESGISAEQRDKANAAFSEGNTLFSQQANQAAVDKYKEALAAWNHPLIQFNMAIALVRLDHFLEAADALEAALRFGDAPFSPEEFQRAHDYQRLLAGRIGNVQASCTQPGVQMLLDAKPWFQCPGTKTQRVLAGEHILVGEKRELATESRRLVVGGGSTISEKVQLRSFDEVVKLEYPTPRWIPWTAAGTGVAIALGGLGTWLAGRNQMDKLDASIAETCKTSCQRDLSDQPLLADTRKSAELKGTIGISMLIAGGAVAVGGVVWALVNRPHRVTPQLEVDPTKGSMKATLGWAF